MNAPTEALPPKETVHTLLCGLIDYAGLFPPSMVSMRDAVANFSSYKNGEHGWMLGRFVVPVARLGEFLESAEDIVSHEGEDIWRLSVLAGEDINATIREINLFNKSNAERVVCDSLEVKATRSQRSRTQLVLCPKG